MDERLNEQVSAAVDGEIDAAEWPLLQRQLSADDGCRGRWSRYHLIGDALRGRSSGPRADNGFADRVASGVAAGEQSGLPSGRSRWLRSAAGTAIAASVAALALLTLRVDEPKPLDEPGVIVPVTANPKLPGAIRYAAGPTVQWERTRPEVQAQLNTLLSDHVDGVAVDQGAVTTNGDKDENP
jgi:sigma-E factor negative regulatory protein RseA